jgi:hypothetical protein
MIAVPSTKKRKTHPWSCRATLCQINSASRGPAHSDPSSSCHCAQPIVARVVSAPAASTRTTWTLPARSKQGRKQRSTGCDHGARIGGCDSHRTPAFCWRNRSFPGGNGVDPTRHETNLFLFLPILQPNLASCKIIDSCVIPTYLAS